MGTVDVIDLKGRSLKSLEIKGEKFSETPNEFLVHSVVVMQQASSRQGTVSTKGRGEVSGTGKKPWKQKHTGRARAGSNRSPIWRHGGTVFGPKPRKYGFSLPKKVYREALRSALTSKNNDGALKVVAGFVIPEPKTRHLAALLRQLGLDRKTLIVAGEGADSIFRAGENLKDVKVVLSPSLNVYDVLKYDVVLVLEEEFEKIQELWK